MNPVNNNNSFNNNVNNNNNNFDKLQGVKKSSRVKKIAKRENIGQVFKNTIEEKNAQDPGSPVNVKSTPNNAPTIALKKPQYLEHKAVTPSKRKLELDPSYNDNIDRRIFTLLYPQGNN